MFGSQFLGRVIFPSTKFVRKGLNWWPSIACASPREHPEVRCLRESTVTPKHHGVVMAGQPSPPPPSVPPPEINKALLRAY